MISNNQIQLQFTSLPENEALARTVISAFVLQKDPTLNIISEVRTAVSEAVTNSIVHAYGQRGGTVILRAQIDENLLIIEVEDFGCGIVDVEQAMRPFFTTKPDEERTGIGFALMQSFMDAVHVESSPNCGTCVRMTKRLDI